MTNERQCLFDFDVPPGYAWLLERGMAGYDPFTALQPWHYLDKNQVFTATDRWPAGPSIKKLVAFARRQDQDDLACFQVEGKRVTGIVVIHGWTSSGYEILVGHATFWDWLKAVVDDIAQWVATGQREGTVS